MGNQQSQNKPGAAGNSSHSKQQPSDEPRSGGAGPRVREKESKSTKRNKLELPDLASLSHPPRHPPPPQTTSVSVPRESASAPTAAAGSAPIAIPGADSRRRKPEERTRPRSRERQDADPGPVPPAPAPVPPPVSVGRHNSDRARGRTSVPAPISPLSPAPTRAVPRNNPSFHPPLPTPGPSDLLIRYESKDGELRRRTTGAERPRSRTPFKKEVITSSIPIGMRRVEKQREKERMGEKEDVKIPTKFIWRSPPAREVYITGSFQQIPWRHKTLLVPVQTSAPSSSANIDVAAITPVSITHPSKTSHRRGAPSSGEATPPPHHHEIVLLLSPGRHKLKFIVDDIYMCSDELQTATDNDGNLVNVFELALIKRETDEGTTVGQIPILVGEPSGCVEVLGMSEDIYSTSPGGLGLGGGMDERVPQEELWSSEDEYTDSSGSNNRGTGTADHTEDEGEPAAQGSTSANTLSPTSNANAKRGGAKKRSVWTQESPYELAYATQLEEEFLANPTNAAHSGILKVIPPAPNLPRFLDKVILNTKEGHERSRHTYHAAASAGNTSPALRGLPTGARPRRPKRHPPSPTPIPAYIATDTPVALAVAPKLKAALINTSEQGAGAGDDKSVLPVPSHVVLNHLATSAIKGGILAAACTVPYRRKYITVMYYKPTYEPRG